MYRLFKSKKGIGTDDVFPLIYTIIAFVFIILFLNISTVSKIKEDKANIESRLNNIKAEQKLLDFLESEVKAGEKTITISDLIVLSVNEDNYDKLTVKLNEQLKDAYYTMRIFDENKRQAVDKGEKIFWSMESRGLKEQISSGEDITSDDAGYSSIILPNPDKNLPLVGIEFVYGKGKKLDEGDEESKTLRELGKSSGP
ncbi:hypothetical protein KY366_01245 [Candidatus Woesearchaeota archaeon]|nr:hypothetical protein [Candidatus Woesearchaeota archaeon]